MIALHCRCDYKGLMETPSQWLERYPVLIIYFLHNTNGFFYLNKQNIDVCFTKRYFLSAPKLSLSKWLLTIWQESDKDQTESRERVTALRLGKVRLSLYVTAYIQKAKTFVNSAFSPAFDKFEIQGSTH